MDFSVSTNYGSDPVNSFFTYFKESFGILIKGVGLGIAVGASLGFAGLIIDFLRKQREPEISESVSMQ